MWMWLYNADRDVDVKSDVALDGHWDTDGSVYVDLVYISIWIEV